MLQKNTTPPRAIQVPKMLRTHGDERTDNYYWLRDRDKPEVINYLRAENAYTDSVMLPTQSLQKDLYTALRARVQEADTSYPVFDNGYFYYRRTREGGEYYALYRKKGTLDAPEELLFDVDALAKGHAYFAAHSAVVSPDNRWLIYGVDTVSRRQYQIYIKNLITQEITALPIKNTAANYVWLADSKRFLYIENNAETLLTENVFLYDIDTKKHELVYTERDESNYLSLHKSRSNKFIFLTSSATLSSEVRYMDAFANAPLWQLFSPRRHNVLYDVDHQENRFIIHTNYQAQNFQVMSCPLDKPDDKYWQPLFSDPEVLIEAVDVFKNYIVLSERRKGVTEIHIIGQGTDELLALHEKSRVIDVSSNPSYELTRLRYVYSSMVTPPSECEYDITTKASTLLKQKHVPNFNAQDYTSKMMYVKSRDGKTDIPVSLAWKKNTPIHTGKTPLLLYAYGSYGISIDPSFSLLRTVLMDQGFVFAIAHIRGGEELGRAWYEDGKLLHKKNTFYDFIDVARALIADKTTCPQHLYAMGGSAGGLLMGAVANMAGDLFHGIVAKVPFVDVLTTMLDKTIPLTTNEYDEWGNPEKKEFYEYMKSYSPYDNVAHAAYPNMLVTTGLHDSQVQYWEPAKWVAKLREYKTDHNVILLKTDMQTGHGGASGRFSYLEEVAFDYAFLVALEEE